MPKYTVLVREIHVSHMEIEAENPEEAIDKIANGEGQEVCLEYDDTMDSCHWTVDDEDGKEVLGAQLL